MLRTSLADAQQARTSRRMLGLLRAPAPELGSPLPHPHWDWAHPCHICTGTEHPYHICSGTGLTPATSAAGLGSPLPHPHPGLGSPPATSAPGLNTPTTSAPGLGSPLPHPHRGLGSPPPSSAPGLGSPLPHPHRDWAHPYRICSGTGLEGYVLRWLPHTPCAASTIHRTPCRRRRFRNGLRSLRKMGVIGCVGI